MIRTMFFLALCVFVSPLYAQRAADWVFNNTVPGKHKGPVAALFHDGSELVSAGEDGFIEAWDIQKAVARMRFQTSACAIRAMVKRPGREEVCLIESDGLWVNRISVWNYRRRENFFTLKFPEPVAYVNYSAAGNFIIAVNSGSSGFMLINSQTGETLKFQGAFNSPPTFAATGVSERSMLAYFPFGELSYWDLATGKQIGRFDFPPNLSSPVLFGNSRYFAGIDASGLALLDAASGVLIDRNRAIPQDSLLCAYQDDLFCLVQSGNEPGVFQFYINRNGRLARRNFFPLRVAAGRIRSFSVNGQKIALGMSDGNVMLLDEKGQGGAMKADEQAALIAASVSGSTLAILTADHGLMFLPLGYNKIFEGQVFNTENFGPYTKISPHVTRGGGKDQFILWQNNDASALPLIVSAGKDEPQVGVNQISRLPLRSAQAMDGKILLLDTAGTLSVLPFGAEETRPFTFSSIGAMDAAFIDRDNIVICRSVISNNTPFLKINLNTGETVPLPWASQAGVMVHRGSSGDIYAATIDQRANGIMTSIIRLNTAAPSQSEKVAEYLGEDIHFSMAEANRTLAATIGGNGAALYSKGNVQSFERTPGFTVQLAQGGNYFVSLDAESNICWHEAGTGRLLAVFRLYDSGWTLQTEGRVIGGLRTGA
jgi:WD40 repeat protein